MTLNEYNIKMKQLEKGQLIEVNIPEIKNSVKAIVLDIIATGMYEGDFSTINYYTYILYVENKLFKMSNKCRHIMCESFTEYGEPISEIFEDWSNLQYDGIIVDNCKIELPF